MSHLIVGKMIGGPPPQERGSYSPSAPPPGYDEAMGLAPPRSPNFTPQQQHPGYDEAMGPKVSPNFTPQQHPAAVQQTRDAAVIHQPSNVVTTTTVVPVGTDSTHMVCPKCHLEINSALRFETPRSAYVASGLICLFGGCLGCFLIPLCMKSFKDVHHSCPSCGEYLGAFPASARMQKRRRCRRRYR